MAADASRSESLSGDFFDADVSTSAGRVRKKLACSDVLSFAKAHVRVRHLEATGRSCSDELQVMRFTSWQEWSNVFGTNARGDEPRSTHAPTPWIPGAKPGELLFRKPHRRVCGKQPRSEDETIFVRHYNSEPSRRVDEVNNARYEKKCARQRRFWNSEWGQKSKATQLAWTVAGRVMDCCKTLKRKASIGSWPLEMHSST